eukprot:TRINITY_DN5310_c0_g1_i7.p1 TRINITY_DN5310_c0_g1~~TRINITY_DN5310_c0_g1_i7.p1  ORF type:complete len:563 (+),score=99.75 TRINITY_DN5310_c0_g1_i7:82-1770(+)
MSFVDPLSAPEPKQEEVLFDEDLGENQDEMQQIPLQQGNSETNEEPPVVSAVQEKQSGDLNNFLTENISSKPTSTAPFEPPSQYDDKEAANYSLSYGDLTPQQQVESAFDQLGVSTEADTVSNYREATFARKSPAYFTVQVQRTDIKDAMENVWFPRSVDYWRIDLVSDSEQFPIKRATVFRRFTEWNQLHQCLMDEARGYILPPSPEKNVVQSKTRKSGKFYEQRREAMQKYFEYIARHPRLSQIKAVLMFLTYDKNLSENMEWGFMQAGKTQSSLLPRLGGTVTPAEVTLSAGKTGNISRMFREQMNKMQRHYVFDPSEESLHNDSKKFDELKVILFAFHDKLLAYVQVLTFFNEIEGECGLTFVALSKFEQDFGSPVHESTNSIDEAKKAIVACQKVAAGFLRSHRGVRSGVSCLLDVVGKLNDVLEMFPQVTDAVNTRIAALNTLETIKRDKELADKQVMDAELAKRANSEKIKEKAATLAATVEAAKAEYENAKQRNQEDVERFKAALVDDLNECVLEFTRQSYDICQRVQEYWANVAKELENLVVEDLPTASQQAM